MHLMIDIETLATTPDAVILTIGAQAFDPFGTGYYDKHFYSRIDIDSQLNRAVEDSTVEWWSRQTEDARQEAFSEQDRMPLDQALETLSKLIWQSTIVWANGPTFDMVILEHAYKSYSMRLPWQYYRVRDCRTVFSLYPTDRLLKPGVMPIVIDGKPHRPASHNALDDCRRQIDILQFTLDKLNVKQMGNS
jgi:hypothetical protein